MRLATWNVNSIRTRVDRVVDWVVREDVDVLAMQEIKCKPEQFPVEAFEDAGYERRRCTASPSGTASPSRAAQPIDGCRDQLSRACPGSRRATRAPTRRRRRARSARPSAASGCGASTCPTAARSATRTTTTSSTGCAALTRVHARAETSAHPDLPLALMGDFNIAPTDADNGDPDRRRRASRRTSRPPEREAFAALEEAGADRRRARRSCPTGYSPTGTTSGCASRATRACASTSSSARTAFADAVDGRRDPPQRAQGRRPERPRAGGRRPRRSARGRRRPADDLRLNPAVVHRSREPPSPTGSRKGAPLRLRLPSKA